MKGGTKNVCQGSAMTEEEVEQCIQSGKKETSKLIDEMEGNIVLFGAVGTGNTMISSTLICTN